VHGENIVVNNGREALARLLGNASGDWFVDTMKFGKGGHDPSDPTIMVAVDITDDDLYDTSASYPEIDVTATTTWPALRKVQFEAEVAAGVGNGTGVLEYSEAGLYYNGGTVMFSHKAFGYIVKNDTIRLVADWTFTF